MSVTEHILSAQHNGPIIAPVQDCLLGVFLLTRIDTRITLTTFYQALLAIYRDEIPDIQEFFTRASKYYPEEFVKLSKSKTIKPKKNEEGEPSLPGRLLFSIILPNDFFFTLKTDSTVNRTPLDGVGKYLSDGTVRIERGILLRNSEVICKKSLCKSNSIVHCLALEYSNKIAADFISRVQFMICSWLPTRGFSIGVADCLTVNDTQIKEVLTKGNLECSRINSSNVDENTKEAEINNVLNNTRNIGQRLAKTGMREGRDNALYCMVASGAKGSSVNISSISSLLGQQNVEGKRIGLDLSNHTRSLYTFEKNDNSAKARGFVDSSYIRGLSPSEFFFHSKGGREGIIDTAIKTATSGYLQRKIVKKLEDYRAHVDGTVRGVDGTILQFAYGGDAFNCSKLYRVGKELTFIDVKKLAQRLNSQVR